MKKILFLGILLITTVMNSQETDLKGKQILIYTRNGEGYVHDNIQTSVTALQEICQKLRIKTMATDDPAIFESEKLWKFDAIIFSNSNNEAFINERQRSNFQQFILSGKGFMGIHSANASERDWPWYTQMIGGKFFRHPKLQSFDIHMINSSHISTVHLPDIWKWEDECYYSDHLNPAIHILLAVDLNTIEDDQKQEYPGDVFGDRFPLAWYHEFKGSRIFYTALGHKIEHYEIPEFRKHLEGGIVWILE